MNRIELGKIKSAEFGIGGYQDCQLGVGFVLGGESWGVQDFWGAWATKPTEHTKWTETDRCMALGHVCMRLLDVLRAAKVESVSNLQGIPIEATFDGNILKSWRVLTEVL